MGVLISMVFDHHIEQSRHLGFLYEQFLIRLRVLVAQNTNGQTCRNRLKLFQGYN